MKHIASSFHIVLCRCDDMISQVEINKARLLTAYNTKNEAIFDEIISTDYIDHGQTSYMDAPGRGVAGAKNDLKHAIDNFDDLNNVVEPNDCIRSLSSSCRYVSESNIDTKSNFLRKSEG